jgi:hypothetical protein
MRTIDRTIPKERICLHHRVRLGDWHLNPLQVVRKPTCGPSAMQLGSAVL